MYYVCYIIIILVHHDNSDIENLHRFTLESEFCLKELYSSDISTYNVLLIRVVRRHVFIAEVAFHEYVIFLCIVSVSITQMPSR